MTIEVKQMLIKSTVLSKSPAQAEESGAHLDLEAIKSDILAECRELMIAILREKQER